jgi:hypothetical protein
VLRAEWLLARAAPGGVAARRDALSGVKLRFHHLPGGGGRDLAEVGRD